MAAFLVVCRFIPTAGGTTDWTYASVVGGCQSPVAANAANGTVYKFLAVSNDLTQWEIAEGTYSSSGAGSFARATVLYNSAGTGTKTPGQSGAGSKINFLTVPQVAIIAVKEDVMSIDGEIGKIEMWPTSAVPTGRLAANGATVSRSTYAALFAALVRSGTATFTNGSNVINAPSHGLALYDLVKLFTTGSLPTNFGAGTHGAATAGTYYFVSNVVDANNIALSAMPGGASISAGSVGSGTHTWVNAPYGDGDGATTFALPDYRGYFLRGWDDGAGVDTLRSIGLSQGDAFQGHFHQFSDTTSQFVWVRPSGGIFLTPSTGTVEFDREAVSVQGPITDGANGTPRTAAETRPKNYPIFYTIRYSA